MSPLKVLNVLDINLDTSEMLLQIDNKKKASAQIIKYQDIIKIECKELQENRWFRTKRVKAIEIFLKGKDEVLVIRDDKLKPPFDKTIEFLKQFAQKKDVTIIE